MIRVDFNDPALRSSTARAVIYTAPVLFNVRPFNAGSGSTPLVGASARVVGNSFLFALSAAPEDLSNNNALLTTRKWMDLALIYATGKRAIITLEKDAAAEQLFSEVFAAWTQTASAEQ